MNFNFETLIDLPNDKYHLDVKANRNASGQHPASIDMYIMISKIIGSEKRRTNLLELRYDMISRSFQSVERFKSMGKLLYGKIIEQLNQTYGNKWGYENSIQPNHCQ